MSNALSGLTGASPTASAPATLAVGGEAEVRVNNNLAEAALRAMGKSGRGSSIQRPSPRRIDPKVEILEVPGFTDLGTESDEVAVEAKRGPSDNPDKRIMEAALRVLNRGGNAAFSYDKVSDSKSIGADPDEDSDQFDVDDKRVVAAKPKASSQAASEAKFMKKFMQECIGSIDSFKFYSGLPMDEHVATSGDVPTPGTDKKNPTKGGGLPGLEGTALQDIEPEDGPCDEDEVGDATYSVLDQNIAMLKKEGIDTDALWNDFLENRGLTAELFGQLVDEAMESNDPDEMDALLAVEGLFNDALPSLLPEGIMDLFKKKKAPTDLSAVRQGGETLRKLGKANVQQANARGMAATEKPKSDINQLNKQLSRATSVVRKGQTESKHKHMLLDVDHDHETGGPKMPWHGKGKKKSKMESLLNKYGK